MIYKLVLIGTLSIILIKILYYVTERIGMLIIAYVLLVQSMMDYIFDVIDTNGVNILYVMLILVIIYSVSKQFKSITRKTSKTEKKCSCNCNRVDTESVISLKDIPATVLDSSKLSRACYKGDVESIRSLILAGHKHDDALLNAVRSKNVDAVNIVIEAGFRSDYYHLLTDACRTNNVDIVRAVIKAGAKVHHDALCAAMQINNKEIVLEIIKLEILKANQRVFISAMKSNKEIGKIILSLPLENEREYTVEAKRRLIEYCYSL